MNRRTAIRNAVLVSVGVAFLPSCMQDKKSALALKHISLTESEEKMLAALSASIIPKTNTFIGAGDLKAHEFVLTMIDDCTSPENQERFSKGMKAFDSYCKEKAGQIYPSCSALQQQKVMTALEIKLTGSADADVQYFYEGVKHYSIQCFTTSQQYMTDIKKYKMVPGPNFKGCVPV